MTYKFVGALRSLTDDKPYQRTAIWIGVAIGFVTEVLRKIIKSRAAYQKFVETSQSRDSPPTSCSIPRCCRRPMRRRSAASSTCRRRRGSPPAACWRASSTACRSARTSRPPCPSDMSTTSLVGGGLDRRRCARGAGLGHRGTARHFVRLTSRLRGGWQPLQLVLLEASDVTPPPQGGGRSSGSRQALGRWTSHRPIEYQLTNWYFRY